MVTDDVRVRGLFFGMCSLQPALIVFCRALVVHASSRVTRCQCIIEYWKLFSAIHILYAIIDNNELVKRVNKRKLLPFVCGCLAPLNVAAHRSNSSWLLPRHPPHCCCVSSFWKRRFRGCVRPRCPRRLPTSRATCRAACCQMPCCLLTRTTSMPSTCPKRTRLP